MATEFVMPDFLLGRTAEDIQQEMMDMLPDGIDDMPGGFPYDFTMPTALEIAKHSEFILPRIIMLMFPDYAWDEWLDMHAEMAHLTRREAGYASGEITVTGEVALTIPEGTLFCTAATDDTPSIEFVSTEDVTIGESATATIPVRAVEAGLNSNVGPQMVVFCMSNDIKGITSVNNEAAITGGTDIEDDDTLRERIKAANALQGHTFIANDADFQRWAKEVDGVGEVIVVGPPTTSDGVVRLVLTDLNGEPANNSICTAVYNHIVSPNKRSARLLPTGSCLLEVVAATNVTIDFVCTGLVFDDSVTDIDKIVDDFKEAVKSEYADSKSEGVLIYNQIRALITSFPGVSDFETFKMNSDEDNITVTAQEYPITGTCSFSAAS